MNRRLTSGATLRRAGLASTAVIAAAFIAGAAHSQEVPSVVIDVGDCVNLKSPGERLDCYERHVEAARSASRPTPDATPQPSVAAAAPPPASPPAAAVIAAAAVATSAAAAPVAAAPPAQPLPSAAAPAAPPEIVATVTALRETVPNAWLITLDNGQVWRQSIPERFALKQGAQVTLRGSRWGSAYRLSTAAVSGFIQVERVR
jgi:hypothetical protein